MRTTSFSPAYWSQVTGVMSACLEDVIHDRQITIDTLPPGVLRETREFLRLAAAEMASATQHRASARRLREIENYQRLLERFQTGYTLQEKEQKVASRLQRFLRAQHRECESGSPVMRQECTCHYRYAW